MDAAALPVGRIRVKRWSRQRLAVHLTLLLLAGLTVYGFLTFDYKQLKLGTAVLQTLRTLGTMFLEVRLSHFTFWEGLERIAVTLGLAFLTTLLGAVLSLFLALAAARNLSPRWTSVLVRGFVAFIRAVPTVLWVLIFAVSAGLGSVAAVVGMSLHTIGYLVKAYSESFEELDAGILEALQASGASWWQIVSQAVLPSSLSYLVSWTFLRFEINFAVSVAMGAAAGAGGIGFDMFMASSFYFDLREVGAITLYILAVALLLELVSVRIRKRMRGA